MKDNLPKLYDFIGKLIIVLEDEFNLLQQNNAKNASATRKNITDTLHKLVILIVQLNKLGNVNKLQTISQSDQDIIDHFLAKYSKEHTEH